MWRPSEVAFLVWALEQMTKTSIGLLLVTGVVFSAACGGGTTTSTGAGGGTTTTTTTTTTGGGGTGGDTTTSTTTSTTSSSSGSSTSTGGPGTDLGGPCKVAADCTGMMCFDETTTGWPSGGCTAACDDATPTCMVGTTTGACLDDGTGMGVCLKTCKTAGSDECGTGYQCNDIAGDGTVLVCTPKCTANAQCPTVGTCDTTQGFCIAPETDCTNGKDDDGDGFIDCEDATSCQGTAACKPGTNDTGHPCTLATDCKATGGDPFCFDEATQGYPKGYCSEYCSLTTNDCTSAGAFCIDAKLQSGNGLCVQGCTTAADCLTPGYACTDVAGKKACLPACTLDSQCAKFCNADTGDCAQTDENCTNGMDDDGDGLIDCEDLDCKATCTPMITMACVASTAAVASNMSDTTTGSDVFGGSCTGSGAHEKIYSITPGVLGDIGTLDLVLSSAKDQGMYVRSACGDATTELACADLQQGGTDEVLQIEVKGGVPLTLFVDGFQAGEEGLFTLKANYASTPPLCTAAAAAVLGANASTTAGSTTAFKGSCTGAAAEEKLFKFTPATTGMLHLVLSSATDQGIYVRSDCNSIATELGCSDASPGGTDETLDVPVTAGTPLTIFVDGFSPGEAGAFTLTVTVM